MKKRITPILYALLAAVFYAVNTPLSKLLLNKVPATFMASFLYLGAGAGVALMYCFQRNQEQTSEHIGKNDMLYAVGMIVLDILAPIFLMLGIKHGTASSASLLGNFEIVATTLVALVIFKETISKRLWIAIVLITASSITLSIEGNSGFQFSYGSLFVLLATACWGLENNCTRSISDKSTYEIVILKGIFSGGGSFMIALILGEQMPEFRFMILTMILGFIAYGMSIFLYVRAQRDLGAAKTSAYYATAPFVGAILSFLLLGESLTWAYFVSLLIMIVGTIFVAADTLVKSHTHQHSHTFTHTHDGITHTHTVIHSHEHNHYGIQEKHRHHHSLIDLEAELSHIHA